MTEVFRGTGVAIVTPFHESGNIDFGSLERIIEHVIGGSVNYIVALGTTGESATLSRDEKVAVLDFVVETVNKRVPIVAGLGGNNTQEVITSIKSTTFDGVNAILSVCPYYNKPQQKGLYLHFKSIAMSCPVPVILYNVPGRTSSNLTAETTVRLASDFENIIGIKEASGNLAQVMEIIRDRPPGFVVISGDDILTLPLLALGAEGVISVLANAFPAVVSEMINLALKKKLHKARSIHYSYLQLTNLLFADGNPSGIKDVLEIIGLCKNHVRLPLVKVSKNVHGLIESQLESILKEQANTRIV